MKFVFILSALLSINAFATSQQLLSITNDIDADHSCLMAKLDDRSDIVHFEIVKCNPVERKNKAARVITIEQAQQHNGVLVFSKQGHEVVRLIAANNLSAHNGGQVQLNYLYNGLTGRRRTVNFDIVRDGDSWSVELRRKKIRNLKFFARRWFNQVVGIGSYKGY